MKRLLLGLTLAVLIALPAGLVSAQDSQNKGYAITDHGNWVKVTKRQRVGAGDSMYYLRKEKVVSISVVYPGHVRIMLEEGVHHELDFVSHESADGFVTALIRELD